MARVALSSALTGRPLARFSPGVRVGNVIQVAGQGPLDPTTGAVAHPGDVGAQTTMTLQAVDSILRDGGATFADVVMVRVYLTDAAHFAAMNEAYGQFVDQTIGDGVAPARTTVMCALALPGLLVEIDALAVLDV